MSEIIKAGESIHGVDIYSAYSEKRSQLNIALGQLVLLIKKGEDDGIVLAKTGECLDIREEVIDLERKVQTTESQSNFPN